MFLEVAKDVSVYEQVIRLMRILKSLTQSSIEISGERREAFRAHTYFISYRIQNSNSLII